LAIVPTKISERIDQQTTDRELLERLNRTNPEKLPNFARITEDEWEQIDNGDLLPKPGIRQDADFTRAYEQGQPVAHYNPDSQTIPHLDEIAAIVENGGIDR
jgi:chromosome partitioning protein